MLTSSQTCFFASPLGDHGSDKHRKADELCGTALDAAATAAGLRLIRPQEIDEPGDAWDQIRREIRLATAVVADVTGFEPNVMFEAGLAIALGVPLVLVKETTSPNVWPFDISHQRTILFTRTPAGLEELKERLSAFLSHAREQRDSAGVFDAIHGVRIVSEKLTTSRVSVGNIIRHPERLDGGSDWLLSSEMQVLQRPEESAVCVVYLHGFGLDGTDFIPVMIDLGFDSYAPTMPGCEPQWDARRRPLGFEAQADLVRDFLHQLDAKPSVHRIIVVGFSVGADLLLWPRCGDLAGLQKVERVVLLDPNVDARTCTFTAVVARKDLTLEQLRAEGQRDDITEWLVVNNYLVSVISKFEQHVATLSEYGRQILAAVPADEGVEPFVQAVRRLDGDTGRVRVRFSQTSLHEQIVQEIHRSRGAMRHSGADDDPIIDIAHRTGHFGLLRPPFLSRLLRDITASGMERKA